ncbi:MAG: DNRLRE domain-containing protein, partial [Caldilinea sp.]
MGSRNAIRVNQIDQDWDATKTTWENQPQYTLADIWEAPPTTDEYITYTAPILSRVVQNWLNQPAENYGLMLGPNASSDGRVFHSVDRRDDQPPLLRVTFVLPPIRVCDDPDCLKPTANAEVVNQTTGKEYASNNAGYVLDDGAIQLGDVLWARIPVERTNNSVRYLTSGEPRAVEAGAFVQPPDVTQPEMRLILRRSLLVRDLQVSTQWNLEGDPAYKEDLARRIVDASDHFYRFTDGQFALGRVTVYQNYDRWDEPATDLWLHASNTMRPLSYIKGEVITPTLDPSPGVDFVYEPGHMYIGSHWNRYGAPPTQPLPPAVDASRDWAAALAHELGHYLLGQFDSYIAVLPSGIVTETFACTGSAMGWVYAPDNQAFVWDNAHWAAACGNTLGALNVKRTEWQTIRTWFEWAQTPETTTPYTSALPIPLTNVVFVPPAGPSPLVNQIFDLDYQNNELPSGEARAFLLRDVNDDGVPDRILDQGKPPQNVAPPQVTLTGAQESDRLCVIDIDTHIDLPDTPRHQFGCRVIQAGDSVLPMRREQAWAPVIQITPLATTQVGISVTQAVEGATVRARLYPEHDAAPTDDLALTPDADQWSGVFSVGGLTPSAFVQVWVEEPATDENPRREAIVDYGIGGGAVPGPKQKIGFAPVTSSDGKAFFLLPAEMSLTEDEFVAIQSMVGILPLPPATSLFGQAYRLIALPPSLVTQGSINVYLADGLPAMTTRTTAASASAQESRSIYFWDGSTWEKLPTTFSTADRGSGESEVLASAASRGVGVYAVLTEAAARVYLPSISR